MKNFILSLIVLFILSYISLFSQAEFVVEIDRTTGNYTKTGPPIAGITYIIPNVRAYNEVAGIFIFPSSDPSYAIYSINVSDGSIVNNPPFNNLSEFEYSNSLGKLFGLLQDNSQNCKYFVSIDPATAIATKIGSSIYGSSMAQGFSAYNQTNNIYIYHDPSNFLYSIDANTGNILSNPVYNLSSGQNIVNFAFDNSTNILYGMLQDNIVNKSFLVTIDPTSGIITKLGLVQSMVLEGGSSTIDEANQQFIYSYSSPDEGGYIITTLDISTGNMIYNKLMTTFTSQDNFFSVKYDNTRQKLYSIHWDYKIDSVSTVTKYSNNEIKIYHNQNNGLITITSDEYFNNAIIRLTNLTGRTISEENNLACNEFTIDISWQPKGIYFLEVIQNGNITRNKILNM